MLSLEIDRTSPRSLASQVGDQLRTLILSGKLAADSRLPSTRELARELGISRTLVLEAFEQLAAEGYIAGRHGSGSFVVPGAVASPRKRHTGRTVNSGASSPSGPAFSGIDFKPGVPALDLFPRAAWARALGDAARSLPAADLGYGPGQGLACLRRETAAWLFRARGLTVDPADICITSGISQALGIASRLIRRPGGRAILENPCQPALSGLLHREGVDIFAARVDHDGIDPARLPRDTSAVCFVTPSHQFPLGPVLSAPRRIALVAWARATDSMILEDDFDGDIRHTGAPLQPLRELDPSRVIYAGSFSKTFAPSLRLGYAVVPRRLAGDWNAHRELMDIHSCTFTQTAMAGCLASGFFERHVRRMKRIYRLRRLALLAELDRAFGSAIAVSGEAAGLHLSVVFRNQCFDEALVARLEKAGVRIHPASRYAFARLAGIEHVLLFGFGNLSEERIAQGIRILDRELDRASAPH